MTWKSFNLIILLFYCYFIILLCFNNEIEDYFINYYRCYDHGEVYSASFLMTKKQLLLSRTNYNLTWFKSFLFLFFIYFF